MACRLSSWVDVMDFQWVRLEYLWGEVLFGRIRGKYLISRLCHWSGDWGSDHQASRLLGAISADLTRKRFFVWFMLPESCKTYRAENQFSESIKCSGLMRLSCLSEPQENEAAEEPEPAGCRHRTFLVCSIFRLSKSIPRIWMCAERSFQCHDWQIVPEIRACNVLFGMAGWFFSLPLWCQVICNNIRDPWRSIWPKGKRHMSRLFLTHTHRATSHCLRDVRKMGKLKLAECWHQLKFWSHCL